MSKLLRLVYVSRACFESNPDSNSMDYEVSDIILNARKNNQKFSIGGVLYFADGYFFQCLEGDEHLVYELFDAIKADQRHSEVKITYCKRIRRRKFGSWTMKYIPMGQEVSELITKLGYKSFNPIEFSEFDVNLIVDLFTRIDDCSLKHKDMREYHRLKIPFWKTVFQRFAL